MSKLSREMMENLSYDEEINASEEMNNLKDNPNFFEKVYILPNLTRENASTLIRNYITELSAIEALQNCIPQYVARRNIEIGLKLVDKTVTDHHHNGPIKASITATNEIPIFAIIRALVNAFQSEWFQINFIFDASRKELVEFLMNDMFKAKSLEEKVEMTINHEKRRSFSSMFIFKLSDVDAAVHHLVESFNDPIAPWKIGYVYVQECCYDEFFAKLQEKIQPYANDILRDQVFLNDYTRTQEIVAKLKASTLTFDSSNKLFPIICREFNRDYFESSRFAPVVSVKSVRTVKEALSLAKTDKANAASIWCVNHSLAYEIIDSLDYSVYWINSFGVIETGVPIKISDLSKTKFQHIYGKSGVHIKNSYHLEYFLSHEGKNEEYYKTVIFPIGVTFAN